jgi:hypothetical protein
MERLLSLSLILLVSIACGPDRAPKQNWHFTLLEMGAWEDHKQWDLFDDRPELYASFKMGSDSWSSTSKTHGSWTRKNLSETFAFSSSTNILQVELLDDDLGDSDDENEDDGSLWGDILFGLTNDADDEVLKANVEVPTGSGLLRIRNDQGYLLIEYNSF